MELEEFGNRDPGWDNLSHIIVNIDQNSEESPGNVSTLDVNQTTMKDHQQTLVWKIRK